MNNQVLLGFPLKRFVKSESQKTDNSKVTKTESNFRTSLDGKEIKKFYQELVAEESSGPVPQQPKPCDQPVPRTSSKNKGQATLKKTFSRNELFRAVSGNDLNAISEALKSRSAKDILTKETDHFGWSALMIASASGFQAMVELLLKAGAETHVKDKAGHTCLSLASKKSHSAIVDLLVNGSRPNVSQKRKKSDDDIELHSPVTCEVCDETFVTKKAQQKHWASTTHRLKVERQNGSELKAYYGIPRSNAGFQMMLRDGWNSDKGLGKDGKGKLYPVKTVLKRDRTGLGDEGQSKAKVTHFGPSDPSSVAPTTKATTTKKKNCEGGQRTLRSGTIDKRKRESREKKSARMEINFRREFL